jgi:hypothetical protein
VLPPPLDLSTAFAPEEKDRQNPPIRPHVAAVRTVCNGGVATMATKRLSRAVLEAAANQAVGPHEAAAIMGLHWSLPARMVAKGWISSSELEGGGSGRRRFVVYDGAECNRNYHEYEEHVAARGGTNDRRPRAWLHLREPMLAKLAAVEAPITFADACSVREASDILDVHESFVPRMIKCGEIVGRRLHGRDLTTTRHRAVYICSRRSCLENAREARKMQAEGKKSGRPRNFS